jgi:hypothetical protein
MAVPYGFISLRDQADRAITEVGVEVVARAVEESRAEHNRQMDALFSSFVETTTEFKTVFQTETAARLQPITERSMADPIQPAGEYEVGYPIQSAGASLGYTYLALVQKTVADAQRDTAMLLSADFRWIRDHILAASYVNGSWTYADKKHGNLTVYGPASGDSTVYSIFSGSDAPATDDHILATASFSTSAEVEAVFRTIHDELMEHPENGGDVIVIVPSANVAVVKAADGFYPVSDGNINFGTVTSTLQRVPDVNIPGTIFGYIEGCFVTEWRSAPSNYLIGFTTEGDRALRMRQYPQAQLQGFGPKGERNKHPWYEEQWERHAGFGAWNRVGLLIHRVDNGTYAVPTNYSSPMK